MSRSSEKAKQHRKEIPRRKFLEAGGLGLLGMGLPDPLRPSESQAAESGSSQRALNGRGGTSARARWPHGGCSKLAFVS